MVCSTICFPICPPLFFDIAIVYFAVGIEPVLRLTQNGIFPMVAVFLDPQALALAMTKEKNDGYLRQPFVRLAALP